MPRPVNFSQKSAKRIASAVRKVEGTARVPFIAQRRRGQILSQDGIAFMSDVDVPAYGAMIRDSSHAQEIGDSIIHLTQATEVHPGPYYLNGSTAVTAGSVGKCNALDGTPRTAILHSTSMPVSEVVAYLSYYRELQLGVVPNTFALGWGLPGFAFLGGVDETSETCLVCAASTISFWGRAYENWRRADYRASSSGNYVMVNPLQSFVHSNPYDADIGPSPEIQVHVLLPSLPSKTNADPSAASNLSSSMLINTPAPNIVYGDPVLCVPLPRIQSSTGADVEWFWRAHGDYLDDPIGTVKFRASYGPGGYAPKGWAWMDGINNAVENGGSGINADGRFIRGKKYSVTAFTFGGSGTSYTGQELQMIERLDNSAS